MRSDWTALPDAVLTAIAERAGGTHATPALSGDHAEIAATVTGDKGKVFVKAASSDLGVRSLRYELLASKAINQSYAPAIEWDFETDGWLVVGFEHVDGPHADLSPASPDLDLLEATLKQLQETPAPGGRPWFSPAARLGFTHPAMDGDTLVHTDLSPTNLIVSPHGLRLVDWAFATKAAPWVELALLVPWLIASGHTPQQAEQWLARRPAWGATNPQILDEFASRNAAKWSIKAQQSTAGWIHDLAHWTGHWSAYRRKKVLERPD
ncbi:phosphotransferase [Jidongwangia harbinensis]|uniref:phosphotransferase n=1 Tax=Jidongwangia harbinensis TaxID=2878561 RepID=UPI001CDA04CC|nr:phosphotransferase [Jidongwangia harbinensis]MCA2216286.1 phosphotransferase [Jidongwangia harbinensis]MCA2217021.1 phosphotransferase [Jidongwangia harbinensis]